ncbi:MAG TPA: hypothetical protein VHL80_11705, partial [Polyangia bacterium]|nr:hypothetical protein [Polyangia bacterium]
RPSAAGPSGLHPAAAPASAPPAKLAAPDRVPPERSLGDRGAADRPRAAAPTHPHVRAEHRAPTSAKGAAASSDSAKRGVLPSGSREAYPDQ